VTLQLKLRVDVNITLKYVHMMISKEIGKVLLPMKDDETRNTRKFEKYKNPRTKQIWFFLFKIKK